MKIKRGTVVVIKDQWDKSGRVGIVLGDPLFVKQWWVPVLFRDQEDPTFYKLAGIEPLTINLPDAESAKENL